MAFSSSSEGDDVLSEINVTPLVDVMLVLLVAFIVTAPVMTNAISVNLPKTVATKPTEQLKPVTLSVDDKGNVYVDKEQVPLDALEGNGTLVRLQADIEVLPRIVQRTSGKES